VISQFLKNSFTCCDDEKGKHCGPVGNYIKRISDFKYYYE